MKETKYRSLDDLSVFIILNSLVGIMPGIGHDDTGWSLEGFSSLFLFNLLLPQVGGGSTKTFYNLNILGFVIKVKRYF